MLKTKEKDTRPYVERLDKEHRARYLSKIEEIGFDPYDTNNGKRWTDDFQTLPPLDFPSITSYLVCGVSAYTCNEFRAYKSTEAHMQYTDGWVQDLKMCQSTNGLSTVVLAKVRNFHGFSISFKHIKW